MTRVRVRVGDGPAHAIASRPGVGYTSLEPWECRVDAGASGVQRALLISDVQVVPPSSELHYAVHPEFRGDATAVEARFAATGIALDLVFDDGSRLSELGLRDQHGVVLSAEAQYAARTLLVDQWTVKRVDLSAVAGRTVAAVEVQWLVPDDGSDTAEGELAAWLDDVRIRPTAGSGSRPSDYVRTTRGTHSSMLYSRGNTLPAVGLPSGAIMATPLTRAGERHWQYAWHMHNGDDNRPWIEAFATTLSPSVWIGERAAFQVMPGVSSGVPDARPEARSLAFSHDDEIDRAHYYSVTFDGGIVAELAPTAHCVAMRFTFPGDDGVLIFDQIDAGGGLTLTPDGERTLVAAWVDAELERVPVVPRMFVAAVIDAPVSRHGMLPTPGRTGVTGYVGFAAGVRTVEVRVATSFISLEQAQRALRGELADGFDDARDRARDLWDETLSVIEVEGATADQLTTLYSNLYRLHLFPNVATEELGESAHPQPHYASPFRAPSRPPTSERAGLDVTPGTLSVNNGYWDTYRTAWPALQLFDPERAGRLLDGFVQHYRDSGWTTRWSAPGHVDVMVGTSSDVIFADAAVKGVPGFDRVAAYDSALRNATVPPSEPAVGRKGLETSIFTGYTSTRVWEGLSWSLEAAINDFGLARFSELLAETGPAGRRDEFIANATYFRSRALGYVAVFDPAVDFFQGRDDDGSFRLSAEEYDPGIWGTDYTETNGWGMAFTVQHDGRGLASLYGGRDGLARKLDAFFATPEPGGHPVRGPYPYLIHEISEAKDIRLGMLALSNQPAHHIPAMYLFAGMPHRTQEIVRECLDRLFLGSEAGQGYPGDEDNGEMSAWWIFNALGFYPLTVGSPSYVITSPLFERATVRLATGRTITVIGHGNGPESVYVQSLTVNGEPWTRTWIPHDVLAAGAQLEFTMGSEPSDWGSADADQPPSLTPPGREPRPLRDAASEPARASGSPHVGKEGGVDAAVAFDDSSDTGVVLEPGAWIEYTFDDVIIADLYTVTAGQSGYHSWAVEAVDDGAPRRIDGRREMFLWDRQTRPFCPAEQLRGRRVRFVNTGAAAFAVHQLEYLV